VKEVPTSQHRCNSALWEARYERLRPTVLPGSGQEMVGFVVRGGNRKLNSRPERQMIKWWGRTGGSLRSSGLFGKGT